MRTGEGFAVLVDLVEIGLDQGQIRSRAVVVVRGARWRDPHAELHPLAEPDDSARYRVERLERGIDLGARQLSFRALLRTSLCKEAAQQFRAPG